MSKFGDILYNKLTDEPSFVLRRFKHFTLVRRPLVRAEGDIYYKFSWFFNRELETLQEQTLRTLETIKARNDIAQAEMGDVPQDLAPLSLALQQFKKSN